MRKRTIVQLLQKSVIGEVAGVWDGCMMSWMVATYVYTRCSLHDCFQGCLPGYLHSCCLLPAACYLERNGILVLS